MCDFSLESQRSRPAKVGDELVTRNFGRTTGLADIQDRGMAVCLSPGTQVAFDQKEVMFFTTPVGFNAASVQANTAIFRKVELDKRVAHHDALEFPDGTIVKLNLLALGQYAKVLQLPVDAVEMQMKEHGLIDTGASTETTAAPTVRELMEVNR